MSRRAAPAWATSGYAPHVLLSRKNDLTFKVECSACGRYELIPDLEEGASLDSIKSFNMQIQDFTTAHIGCGR